MSPEGIWDQVADPVKASGNISDMFIDSSDTLWVIDNEQLYRKPKGATEFIPTRVDVYGPARLAESNDHTLWVAEVEAGPVHAANLQHVNQNGDKLFAPRVQGPISDLISAPDGSLWIAKYEGLQRLSADVIATGHSRLSGNAPDLYTRSNVSKDFDSNALLSDFDGNIWVGGTGGLDRFEHANLTPAISEFEDRNVAFLRRSRRRSVDRKCKWDCATFLSQNRTRDYDPERVCRFQSVLWR